jgi:hypothetical protein
VRPGSTERSLALALAGGRMAIGVGFWLTPGLIRRVLGFDEFDDEALTIARIAGTRDLILGAWQASAAGDRERLRTATLAVAACDAGDTAAFAALIRSGRTGPGARGVAAALPATIAGLALASRLGPPSA